MKLIWNWKIIYKEKIKKLKIFKNDLITLKK